MIPDWLAVALEDYDSGVKEIAGEAHDPRILAYHATTSLKATTDEVPWCAAFVCFCLESAGLRSTRSARARSFLGWGGAIHPPAYGSLVILRRGSGAGAAGPEVIDAPGHVGFLLWASARREVLVLGGNQGDRISIATYPRSRVLGFRWPVLREG